MSEELRRGIIKAIPLGERREFTEEDKEKIQKQTEEMFRFFGVDMR